MKFKKLLIILLIPLILASCSKISLDNAENLEFTHKYAKTTLFGNQKKINKTYPVTQACDFTNKYIALLFNRDYRNVTGREGEILYADSYNPGEEYFEAVKKYYTSVSAVTEVSSTKINHVIMIGGDAYVNVTANIILKQCESNISAKTIGFTNGVGSTMPCELNLKLKFKGTEYTLYGMDWVENENSLMNFAYYGNTDAYNEDEAEVISALDKTTGIENAGDIRQFNEADVSDAAFLGRIKGFINNLAAKQNNRDYKTLSGDEDYPLLSDEYIRELSKERDDISYTKEIYSKLKLVTELEKTDIKSVEFRKDEIFITVDITSKIKECASEDTAVQMGYTGGIGSSGVMSFEYTVKEINGSLKLVDSNQTI